MSCSSSNPPSYCSAASPELKLYQTFIFSVPVFFTFVLLMMFYFFYIRRRRANWQSLQMRASQLNRGDTRRGSELGIKKELREMLPVVVFKESFLIRETQCSVCLGDYQSEERLQRIPPCGHTFHVDCIDHWLATNSTCPLCRSSLLPTPRSSINIQNQEQINEEVQMAEQQSGSQRAGDTGDNEAEERENDSGDEGLGHGRREVQDYRHNEEGLVVVNPDFHANAVEC